MENSEIIKILNNIADILELQEDRFRPNAYRRAARSIENLNEDLMAVHQRGELQEIPGIGIHIAAKIEELLKTGKLKYYDKLKKTLKIDVEGLNEIPALGPKKIKVLYEKLKIKNVKDLQKALNKHKIRELEGFGERSEQLLQEGINAASDEVKRRPYKDMKTIVTKLLTYMKKCPAVKKIEVAGSFRRKKESVRDVDLLVISNNNSKVMEHFINYKERQNTIARGETRGALRLKNNIQVDLRIVKNSQFGSALLYFTGSKEHNVELRRIALKQGMTLNEYGLFTLKDKTLVASKTEKDIYSALGFKLIPPEERINREEFNKYRKK